MASGLRATDTGAAIDSFVLATARRGYGAVDEGVDPPRRAPSQETRWQRQDEPVILNPRSGRRRGTAEFLERDEEPATTP